MSRTVRVVVAVLVAQVSLVGVYWLVEQRRASNGVPGQELSTAPPQHLDGQVPPLSLRTRDGDQFVLRGVERPTLVHFWATWCPPCRAELPALLALPEEHPVDVVAVALDKEWVDVDLFLGGRAPPGVFLGDSAEIERALGVRSLPVTYLVGPKTRLRLLFDGARDWRDSRFLSTWLQEIDRDGHDKVSARSGLPGAGVSKPADET